MITTLFKIANRNNPTANRIILKQHKATTPPVEITNSSNTFQFNNPKKEKEFLTKILTEGIRLGKFDIDSIPLTADIIHYCTKGLEIPYIYGRLSTGLPSGMSRAIVQKLIHKALKREDFKF